jgi:hypothetical protein
LPNVDFNVDIEARYEIKKWSISISDASESEIKKFEGTGEPSRSTKWDLLDSNGNPASFDANYTVIVTVEDEQQNKVSLPQAFRVSKSVDSAE